MSPPGATVLHGFGTVQALGALTRCPVSRVHSGLGSEIINPGQVTRVKMGHIAALAVSTRDCLSSAKVLEPILRSPAASTGFHSEAAPASFFRGTHSSWPHSWAAGILMIIP